MLLFSLRSCERVGPCRFRITRPGPAGRHAMNAGEPEFGTTWVVSLGWLAPSAARAEATQLRSSPGGAGSTRNRGLEKLQYTDLGLDRNVHPSYRRHEGIPKSIVPKPEDGVHDLLGGS